MITQNEIQEAIDAGKQFALQHQKVIQSAIDHSEREDGLEDLIYMLEVFSGYIGEVS